MPNCLKCGEKFPISIKIDGKKRNLCSRQYCFKCSPFKEHNTKQIHCDEAKYNGPCIICGDTNNKKAKRTKICYTCVKRKQELEKCNKLYGIIGEKCWVCGYDKGFSGRSVLDFHHLLGKDFCLTKRNVGQISFKLVLEEVKKCILVCCRCHREIHAGIIDENVVNSVYKTNWAKIDKNFDPKAIDEIENKNPEYMDSWLKKVNDHLFKTLGHKPNERLQKKKCKHCSIEFLPKSSKIKFCSIQCRSLADRKVERPSKEQLQKNIETMSWCAMGRLYNVSDNAVRKWARIYGIIE